MNGKTATRPTNEKARLGRPRSSTVDRAIQKAALELFIDSGLDGVGIDQIAKRAGVARTTVYRRWTSPESIVADAIAAKRGTEEQKVMIRKLSPQVMVDRVVDALADTVTSGYYRKMPTRLIGSAPDHPELMSRYWDVHLAPRREMVKALLEQARSGGLIPWESDPDLVLDLIGGAVMYHPFVSPVESSDRELRSYLREVLGQLGVGGDTRDLSLEQ